MRFSKAHDINCVVSKLIMAKCKSFHCLENLPLPFPSHLSTGHIIATGVTHWFEESRGSQPVGFNPQRSYQISCISDNYIT